MNPRTHLPLLLVTGLLIASCNSSNSDSQNAVSDQIEDRTIDNSSEREPLSDEILEVGLVKDVQDGIYPFSVVTIEMPKSKAVINFDINVEEVGIDNQILINLKDKYLSFYYTSEMEKDLQNLFLGDKSLVTNAPSENDHWSEVTGILKGADHETAGDLPGTLVVTDADGEIHMFNYYVDELMTSGQDKEVTAYFTERPRNRITFVKQKGNSLKE
jgi:hypothetical protein